MPNVIDDWLKNYSQDIKDKGFVVSSPNNEAGDTATSFNIDSEEIVGTVSFWEPNIYEVQFNSCKSGEVVFLDTNEINNVVDLNSYIQNALSNNP